MAIQGADGHVPRGAIDVAPAPALLEMLASTISVIFSPPVMTVAMMLICTAAVGGDGAWRATALYLSLAIGAPLAYLGWLVARGEVTDLDVQHREQRTRPLLFSLAAMAAGWFVLLSMGVAPLLLATGGIVWLLTALITGITLQWKVSVHAAAIAACCTLLWFLFGAVALAAVWLVPAVAWSRIYLKRHTPAQTIVGASLGLGLVWIVLHLIHLA